MKLFQRKCQILYVSYSSKLLATTAKRNWVFGPNSDFLITMSLEPNVLDLTYFKLWIMLNQIIRVWNIKGLQDIWFCCNSSNQSKLIEWLTILKISDFSNNIKQVYVGIKRYVLNHWTSPIYPIFAILKIVLFVTK